MKFLRCPHCEKNAANLWELFFISFFWLNRVCRHCHNKIRFDFNTITLIVLFLAIAIILLNVIDRLFAINIGIYSAIIMIFFMYIPFIFGKKLFKAKQ